jgi:hypothetical protein
MGRRRARFGYRSLVVALGMALAATGPAVGSPAVGAAPPTIRGHVRVDQVGYATGEAKRAFLLAEGPAGGARFAVVDAGGRTVLSGRVGRGPAAGTAATGRCTASTSAGCAGRAAT